MIDRQIKSQHKLLYMRSRISGIHCI